MKFGAAIDNKVWLPNLHSSRGRSARPSKVTTRRAIMRWIAGGTYRMGADDAYPEEASARAVAVDGFWMDEYAVTNTEFAAFVAATGYRTIAERPLDPASYPG